MALWSEVALETWACQSSNITTGQPTTCDSTAIPAVAGHRRARAPCATLPVGPSDRCVSAVRNTRWILRVTPAHGATVVMEQQALRTTTSVVVFRTLPPGRSAVAPVTSTDMTSVARTHDASLGPCNATNACTTNVRKLRGARDLGRGILSGYAEVRSICGTPVCLVRPGKVDPKGARMR